MKAQITGLIKEAQGLHESLLDDKIVSAIAQLVELISACLNKGGKVILFGNGGSAADAQHIAAELVGRFAKERGPLAAMALTCNSSNLTAISNDYEFKQVFTRQIEGLGKAEDLAIAISTSGRSENVLSALAKAKEMGMKTAGLSGQGPNQLAEISDLAICVPSKNTARIQECHIMIGHIICELTEKAFL